ncbi:MAG: type II toxin-antitoxin system Phd/YefM family antitoxin [Thermoleophilia bacterium]
MKTVGVRALKQNASAVVAEAASGETVIITDRGEPVAQLLPLGGGALRDLERAGLVRKRRHSATELPPPLPAQRALSDAVLRGRDDERF